VATPRSERGGAAQPHLAEDAYPGITTTTSTLNGFSSMRMQSDMAWSAALVAA